MNSIPVSDLSLLVAVVFALAASVLGFRKALQLFKKMDQGTSSDDEMMRDYHNMNGNGDGWTWGTESNRWGTHYGSGLHRGRR